MLNTLITQYKHRPERFHRWGTQTLRSDSRPEWVQQQYYLQ